MTSPIKRKLRSRITALRSDDTSLSKRLTDCALDGNVDALVGIVLENRPDFHILIKDKVGAAFSDWNYESVLNFFGMTSLEKMYTPPAYTCPKFLLDYILKQLEVLTWSRGDMLGTNEKCKEKFIDVILNSFVGTLRSFIIKDEEALSGLVASGNVEYVFKVGFGFIGLLLEAKKRDIEQGYAQLLIEMFTAHRMNIARGYKQAKFIGILSTGELWYFVEYRRGMFPPFRTSKAFYLDVDDKERFSQLINTFYAFLLDIWADSLAIWYQSRVESITATVADDADPAPDDTEDDATNKLAKDLDDAIKENKAFTVAASVAHADDEAAMTNLQSSNVKVKGLMSKWEADFSVYALMQI